MHFCNEYFAGKTLDHKYRIYTSNDNGKSFEELRVLPLDTYNLNLSDEKGNFLLVQYSDLYKKEQRKLSMQ